MPVHLATFVMSTRSALYPRPPNAARRVSGAICRGLQTVLPTLARRRHGAEVTVHCPDRARAEKSGRLRLTCSGHLPRNEQARMVAQLCVTHVGGNMYDVDCAVEGGSSRRFTYCLPRCRNASSFRIPDRGRSVGAFLLDELERQVGRRRLHGL
jgi:hypothetical protein